jgi:hypothetical protein
MITFGPVPSRRLGKSLGINNIILPKLVPTVVFSVRLEMR